jgi:hypothetical protein
MKIFNDAAHRTLPSYGMASMAVSAKKTSWGAILDLSGQSSFRLDLTLDHETRSPTMTGEE